MARKKVPDFKSEDQLIRWTESADLGEYELEEASDVEVARPELETITLRLDKEDIRRLKQRARATGVGHTTLARMILHRALMPRLRGKPQG